MARVIQCDRCRALFDKTIYEIVYDDVPIDLCENCCLDLKMFMKNSWAVKPRHNTAVDKVNAKENNDD